MTPSSEVWPLSLLTLWAEAGVCGQRRALRYRLSLRASPKPDDVKRHPKPTDPLLLGIYTLELAFRDKKDYCRGAVERD